MVLDFLLQAHENAEVLESEVEELTHKVETGQNQASWEPLLTRIKKVIQMMTEYN